MAFLRFVFKIPLYFIAECADGDVGILWDNTPLIYLNQRWTAICSARFAEDDIGANFFCKRLAFPSGHAFVNSTVSNKEDAIMIGKCLAHDSWPICTGGCNWRTIGHRCSHYIDVRPAPFVDCSKDFKPKLFITCSGPSASRSVFSCPGNKK